MTDEGQIDELDRLTEELQSRIDAEEAEVFSRTTLEEARHPSNLGPMEDATGKAHRKGTCGDSMDMFVRFEGDRLVAISFLTDGCGATIACGSMLTRKARGLTAKEAMALTDEDLLEWLDGLPEENLHCAKLAIGTLHGAVNDARPYWQG
jgi:nitrogen fixation NifU-like protein